MLICCILLLFLVSVPYKSSAFVLPNHNEILVTKTNCCSLINIIKVDSIANFSINRNGMQNSVKIISDSIKIETTESIITESKDSKTIEIKGKGNSVSISQESKGKIMVKQNEKN